ncbi:MAG: DUF2849 domain-containing protein [Myxococcota bacterium]|nr:DUF2849 domain-containing protein [Myxococcota bacterium]
MRAQVLTANRTADGVPLYHDVDGVWQADYRHAHPFTDADEAQAALANARRQEAYICDPYLLKVKLGADGIELASQREAIRGDGADTVLARLGYPRVGGESLATTEEA